MLLGASLGPWESGSLGYSGVDSEGGILTLLGGGVIALAVWKWATSQRRRSLLFAEIVAILCVSIAVYSVFDIRDFYADTGNNWMDRIGWGLIVTLASAFCLAALFLLMLWRTRSRLRKRKPLS